MIDMITNCCHEAYTWLNPPEHERQRNERFKPGATIKRFTADQPKKLPFVDTKSTQVIAGIHPMRFAIKCFIESALLFSTSSSSSLRRTCKNNAIKVEIIRIPDDSRCANIPFYVNKILAMVLRYFFQELHKTIDISLFLHTSMCLMLIRNANIVCKREILHHGNSSEGARKKSKSSLELHSLVARRKFFLI